MKIKIILLTLCTTTFLACVRSPQIEETTVALKGTWQLLSATTLDKGKSTVIDFTKGNKRMIKIINDTHFAFLNHDLDTAKNSNDRFDAGGGRYKLAGNEYTEYLDFYKDKNWEGKTFNFKVSIHKDTLIQTGMEKVEAAGVDRVITEKYVRVKENLH
ncbi:hypothetical protein [Pedobacter sp. Hv1]|uniref:hypothetical protein n=1 Tax=Pedobacter sp. Hv1 TaxID=1740090 RepID=UPI0006D8CEA8|nr:hypothetical protein [Pedobacter sp. Hv1]KQC01303.1 hypothetical protein AQF98_09355 [Pedobacter sp. Hv1]